MKIIFFILLLLSLTWANHISWYGDYDKAFAQAQKEQKPLMVLLVKKDSSQCRLVVKNAFMNNRFVDILNKNVISVIVTSGSRASYPREMYYTTIFPALFFVNYRDEAFLTTTIKGNINKKDIEKIIKKLYISPLKNQKIKKGS